MNRIVLTQEEKDFIKKSLLEKKPMTWLVKQLNYSIDVITRESRIIMGEGFDFRRKSYINQDYFEDIDTPEKAYWLGFIAANGYIIGHELNIQLQKRDKKHLQKFSDAINGNLTIRDINGKNNFGTEYFHYRISISSKKMTTDLAKYGIIPKKSLILKRPNIDPSLYQYWIIGYLDGGGCISKNKKKIRVSFTGTMDVLIFIKEYLNSKAVISLEHRCQHTYNIQVENDVSINFLIKTDYANLPFALERKKQIVSLYLNGSNI